MIEANPFGPLITPENVIFRLWAPGAQRVELLHHQNHEMQRTDDGWFKLTIPGARPGDRYKFRIDGEVEVPDPASSFQPDDVHGPSEVIDHNAFDWQTRAWPGRPWHECAFLELHVGTFTKEGTFRGVIDKLDDIAAAGITAIELMPVADFSGRWNWGYDGVLLYAPDSTYGRPEDLKTLVDAAHARGLMVFLDVVYNHFGPEGNYLGQYAPQFFTPAQTPWGNAIDYERPEVRRFAVENALHWLSGFSLRRAASRCRARDRRAGARHAASRNERGGRHAGLADRAPHPSCAGERRQPGEPARSAHRSAARQVSRAVERRLPPRLPCAADRRDGGLLRRLQGRGATCRSGARGGLRLSGRAVAASPRGARRTDHHPARHGVRQFPAEPRPDRQPGARRTARRIGEARGARSGARHHAAGAGTAAAVHGRAMGRARAVPILLRFQGRAGRSGAQRPAQGIPRRLCPARRRGARSALGTNRPLGDARLGGSRASPNTGRGSNW